MALLKMQLPVLISSKQAEFERERADIVKLMASMPLLAVDAAERWSPASIPVQHESVFHAERCAIYVALFGCRYSNPTILEYEAAAGNLHREVLIYIRDCDNREPPLHEFLERVSNPTAGPTVVHYSAWSKVRERFVEHLWDATGRMVQHLLRLGAVPSAMGAEQEVFEKRWL